MIEKSWNHLGNGIPKIIWTYWSQANVMPEFNKLCIETWRKKNPDFVIHVLNDENILKFISLNELPKYFFEITPLQSRSDVVRLALLKKYGGIWMDSSIICLKSLTWCSNPILTGYSVTWNSLTNELDVFDSWFIACNKNSYIIKKWHDEYMKLWLNRKTNLNIHLDPFLIDVPTALYDKDYLNIHHTFLACSVKDLKFKEEYNKATITNALDDGFYHYRWYGGNDENCSRLLNEFNQDFINDLKDKDIKILKFTGGNCNKIFKDLKREDFMKKSTLGYLFS